jgi:LuxR family maltose regulon positive regulatory protein
VLDYLMEAGLDALDPETLEFMLATSVVDTVCGPLADALTDGTDSARRLADIERANVFITPLDERREWYRYHGLLAELLRHRAASARSRAGPGAAPPGGPVVRGSPRHGPGRPPCDRGR